MEEKEILKLLRVRKKHLNKKVSGGKLKIRYCRNVSSTKNEFNYFVVNNNISEISFPRKREETGYILEHSIDYKKRPIGARYFIKQGDGDCQRSASVTPSYWNRLKLTTDYDKFFRRGILLPQRLVAIRKCLIPVIEGKSLSLFRQSGVMKMIMGEIHTVNGILKKLLKIE